MTAPTPPAWRRLPGRIPATMALLLPLAACGLVDDGVGTEGDQTPPGETIGLPSEVENGDDSALLLEPNPDTPIEEEYQIVAEEDGRPRTIIVFREATATDHGMAFTFEVSWHPNNDNPVVEHHQFFVAADGERHTPAAGEEAATPGGTGEQPTEVTVTIPGAPQSGAIYYQGPDYDADGEGLPPIGVCYQADTGFDTDSCAG